MLAALTRKLCSGVVLLAAMAGCSDDDPAEDPVKLCNQMVDTYCSSVVDCLVDGGSVASEDRDATVDECKAGADAAVDCSKAIGVSASYDDCLATLKYPDCDSINQSLEQGDLELPATCNGVIAIQG